MHDLHIITDQVDLSGLYSPATPALKVIKGGSRDEAVSKIFPGARFLRHDERGRWVDYTYPIPRDEIPGFLSVHTLSGSAVDAYESGEPVLYGDPKEGHQACTGPYSVRAYSECPETLRWVKWLSQTQMLIEPAGDKPVLVAIYRLGPILDIRTTSIFGDKKVSDLHENEALISADVFAGPDSGISRRLYEVIMSICEANDLPM